MFFLASEAFSPSCLSFSFSAAVYASILATAAVLSSSAFLSYATFSSFALAAAA